jgi:hypothetical protein
VDLAGRDGAPSAWTSELVITAFEHAMTTMRALPSRGCSTRLASLRIEVAPDDWPAETSSGALKLPTPSPRAIDEMDRVLSWTNFIPSDRITLRKLVALRATTHHATGKPMSWRRIARELHADAVAVQRWHGQAVSILARALNARRIPVPGARATR